MDRGMDQMYHREVGNYWSTMLSNRETFSEVQLFERDLGFLRYERFMTIATIHEDNE